MLGLAEVLAISSLVLVVRNCVSKHGRERLKGTLRESRAARFSLLELA